MVRLATPIISAESASRADDDSFRMISCEIKFVSGAWTNLGDNFSCSLVVKVWVGVFGIGKKVVALSGAETQTTQRNTIWSQRVVCRKRSKRRGLMRWLISYCIATLEEIGKVLEFLAKH
jgi:hypothetical protein